MYNSRAVMTISLFILLSNSELALYISRLSINRYVTYDWNETNKEIVCVDGFHPALDIISHGKPSERDGSELLSGDTSTEIVIHEIERKNPVLSKYRQATCNHFDVDACLAVWCLMNPTRAIEHKFVLIEAARIDDVREMTLSNDRVEDPVTCKALKLCCWITNEEQARFWKQYQLGDDEHKRCCEKFHYFLPRISELLKRVENDDFKPGVYTDVIDDIDSLYRSPRSQIERWDDVGIVVIHVEKPLEYYALFSCTRNADVVVTIYPENKYEIECKYSQWIQMVSRDSWPRIALQPLCDVLNTYELDNVWTTGPFDSLAPIMRLYPRNDAMYTKEKLVDEYSGPKSRIFYPSEVSEEHFLHIVRSYFQHSNIKPKRLWSWNEVDEINDTIDWTTWSEKFKHV